MQPVEPPKTLSNGRYKLESQLGVGGAASVYRAYDTTLEVPRAIKILHGGHSTLRKRMEAEAKAMARLNHNNVLRVYDIGTDQDVDFIVMDLAEAGTLGDLVDSGGPLSESEALKYAVQVLAALAAAHEAGIVHRDVKPQNVLIDRDGTALLADFGIALVTGDVSRGTRTGVAMGSLAYMPPEQRLDARSVGATADIYAVGATIYLLLPGRNPVDLFTAKPDSKRWAGLSEPVRDVIRRATAMNPTDRYADAGHMAGDILALLAVASPKVLPRPTELPADGISDPERHRTLPTVSPPTVSDEVLYAAVSYLTDMGVEPSALAPGAAPDDGEALPAVLWRARWLVLAVFLGAVLLTVGLSQLRPAGEPAATPAAAPVVSVEAPEPRVDPVAPSPVPEPAAPAAPVAAPSPATAPEPAGGTAEVAPKPKPLVVEGGPPPLGIWRGSLNGQRATLRLTGGPDALQGQMEMRIGELSLTTAMAGSWSEADRTLHLADTDLDMPDAGVYEATLDPDLKRMRGTFTYNSQERVVPFSFTWGP